MYLTILLTIGFTAYLGLKSFQAIKRLIRGERRSQSKKQQENTHDAQKIDREKEIKEAHEKVRKLERKLDKSTKIQYTTAAAQGIVEKIYSGNDKVTLDTKGLAGYVTSHSTLTQLEFENRLLADKQFCGFNFILTDGEKLTLTFHGQALASITKIPEPSDMRINIFPPFLESTMTTKDVGEMFDFLQNASSKDKDALGIFELMTEAFTNDDNIKKLKQNITPKIQANESRLTQKSDKKIAPKIRL